MLILAIIIVGVVILAWVAISLCFYKIALKLGSKYPWLAWVPIVQSFYILYMAQFPAWLIGVLIVATIIGGTDRKFGLLNILTAIGWIFAWMKISEMRHRPRWWGIIMIIPIVNLIVLYYLTYQEAEVQPASVEPAEPTQRA